MTVGDHKILLGQGQIRSVTGLGAGDDGFCDLSASPQQNWHTVLSFDPDTGTGSLPSGHPECYDGIQLRARYTYSEQTVDLREPTAASGDWVLEKFLCSATLGYVHPVGSVGILGFDDAWIGARYRMLIDDVPVPGYVQNLPASNLNVYGGPRSDVINTAGIPEGYSAPYFGAFPNVAATSVGPSIGGGNVAYTTSYARMMIPPIASNGVTLSSGEKWKVEMCCIVDPSTSGYDFGFEYDVWAVFRQTA